jgi:hypothetical protein
MESESCSRSVECSQDQVVEQSCRASTHAALLSSFESGSIETIQEGRGLFLLCLFACFSLIARVSKYTNLTDEPVFDYKTALADHISRDRENELHRAASLGHKKKKIVSEPKAPREKQQKKKKKRHLDSDGDSLLDERDAEERFNHGDESDSFVAPAGTAGMERRPKSARVHRDEGVRIMPSRYAAIELIVMCSDLS